MALTRKFLKGMGIEDEKVESIIEAHSETVEGLTKERDTLRAQAEKVQDLQKQLEDAKAAAGDNDGWEKKYRAEHKAFEDFKAEVDAKQREAMKEKAYRKLLADAKVDPKRMDSIMRVTDLSGVELDEDGKVKDADKLAESIASEWADFVVKTKSVGSMPATPPKTDAAAGGADPEIAKRMQERHERMFGTPQAKE